VEVAPQER